MATYTDRDIAALATLIGVTVPERDLAEVALRLTVLVNEVERVTDPAIDSIDPNPLGETEFRV